MNRRKINTYPEYFRTIGEIIRLYMMLITPAGDRLFDNNCGIGVKPPGTFPVFPSSSV